MSTGICKRCGSAKVVGRKFYCDLCREEREEEKRVLRNRRNREKYRAKIGGKYKFNKNHGIEEFQRTEEKRNLTEAEKLWQSMTLREISAECARYHITYGQAQVMVKEGCLPEGFGKEKRRNA